MGRITLIKSRIAIVGILLAASSTAVQAKDGDDARFKVGITAGTLGIGPEVSYRLSERLGVRGVIGFPCLIGARSRLLHGSGAGWRGHISKSLPRIQSA
jgi:hypothetical protein